MADGEKRMVMESRKRPRERLAKIPKFLGKKIRHKMVDDDGKAVWYSGTVVSVLDDNEFNEECEFEVKYDGYEDVYEIQVVKEWRLNCIVVEGNIEIECKRSKMNLFSFTKIESFS